MPITNTATERATIFVSLEGEDGKLHDLATVGNICLDFAAEFDALLVIDRSNIVFSGGWVRVARIDLMSVPSSILDGATLTSRAQELINRLLAELGTRAIAVTDDTTYLVT